MQMRDHPLEPVERLHGVNGIQDARNRMDISLFDGFLVHAGLVVISNFLFFRRALGIVLRILLQNSSQNDFAPAFQLVEASPAGMVARRGVLGLPLATGIGVKVVAWI